MVVLLLPHVATPIVLGKIGEKESQMFEPQASFRLSPNFDLHNREPEGRRYLRRLSLLTFFGEAKKVSGRRATPGLRTLRTNNFHGFHSARHWIPARAGMTTHTELSFEFLATVVASAFDFNPLLTLPIVRGRKWKKKASLFERSEFRSFPIFCLAQLGTRRAVAAWSPFFAYFLWRSKESEWPSGHTRPAYYENG